MHDKVSVIIPAFNSEKTITRCINSVLDQTYQNFEVIVINDNSSDNSRKKIESIKDQRIKIINNNKNYGAGISRNKGIEISKGSFIAFLDSDDWWMNKKLEKQISFMKDNNLNFSFTSYTAISKNYKKIIDAPCEVRYEDLLKENPIGCSTVVYKKSFSPEIRMSSIRMRQDWKMWIDFVVLDDVLFGLQSNLTIYNADGGMSKNYLKLLYFQYKFYRTQLKFSVIKSLISLIMYFSHKALKSYKSVKL